VFILKIIILKEKKERHYGQEAMSHDPHWYSSLMMPKIVSELHSPHML